MSRVVQFRTLVSEVISHNSRARLINNRALCCQRFFESKPQNSHFTEPRGFLVFSSKLHITSVLPSDEPLHQSAQKDESDDKRQPSQFDGERDEDASHSDFQSFESPQHESPANVPNGTGEESVINRLRRLSMTPAEEYEPSEMAQEKAREMSIVRKETIKKGEQWKWEQTNLRPGGPPPRQYGGYNRRDNNYGRRQNQYDDEDNYYEPERRPYQNRYNERRSGSYDSFGRQPPRSSRYDDDDTPGDYEQEMEKLRARLHQNKLKKTGLKSNEGEDSERNAFNQSSSSPTSQHSQERISETASTPLISETSATSKFENHNERAFEENEDFEMPTQASWNRELDKNLAAEDPDTFGNLSFPNSGLVRDRIGAEMRNQVLEEEAALAIVNEEEEEDDTRFIPPYGEKWTNAKLIDKVRELLKEKKLKEAVDTYLGVLKQGGFHFDHNELRHHFNVLINECADVGYVEMAFRLFNLMKKRGYKEGPRTISSLFNACANSPWNKEANLDKIDRLLINMKDRGLEPNLINYHALIKAYGRMGETVRAFHVVDKMIEESQIKPVTETFNMLLQACISDTKNGFRYTLITWQKMISMWNKLRPDVHSYNLLFKAIKDCGIELKDTSLPQILSETKSQQLESNSSVPVLLNPIMTQKDSNLIISLLISESSSPEDAKVAFAGLGEVVITNVKALEKALAYPSNRLAVLGGVRGIITQMIRHKVGPNLKTLTGLLELTSGHVDISDVLQLLTTYKIKPDVIFFNAAIKQCYRFDNYKLAEDILKLMNSQYHITPDIVTWGVLATGCRTWMEAKTLLAEMESSKFLPNFIILKSLLTTALQHWDPRYVLHLMEETKRRGFSIDEAYILKIDRFIANVQKGLVFHEMGKVVEPKKLAEELARNPEFPEHFRLLKMRYGKWIHEVDVKIDPANPWKEDFEHFKAHKKHKTVPEDDNKYESLLHASSETSASA